MSQTGAIRLEPVFLQKVWGAEELNHPLAKVYDPPPNTGEIWLASDSHHITPVAEGQYKGLGLDELIRLEREWILGAVTGSNFPILLKILNVGQWLSVQVHPDDAQAKKMCGDPFGKTEAWYVLSAEPDAKIIMGLKPGVDVETLQGSLDSGLKRLLAKVPARQGEMFHLPAGTVHSTGPGLVIFEIQQASDTTFRFYDWDRPGDDGKLRELHQDQALKVMKVSGPGKPLPPREIGPGVRELVRDPYFQLVECNLPAQGIRELPGGSLKVLYVLEGEGCVTWGDDGEAQLEPGQSWLLPAGVNSWRIKAAEKGLTLLESGL
jgi:mannose-6-phosphate isomerase